MKKFIQNPLVQFFSFVITFLSVILQIFNENEHVKICALCCGSFLVLLGVIYLICRYTTIIKLSRKIKKKFINKYFPVSNFYADLLHQQMTTLTQLKNRDIDDEEFFKSCILNFCQLIHDKLNQLLNIDFAVCIKSIYLKGTSSIEVNEWKTKTVARTASTNLIRRSARDNEFQLVIDNTSFLHIIKENLLSWAAFDIDVISKQLKDNGSHYKNPDQDYSRYYKSTIVIPIVRQYKNITSELKTNLNIPQNTTYHYLGFLCLDSEERFASNEDEIFQAAINLTLPLGELLYQVFSEKILLEIRSHAQKQYNKIKKGEKNAKI